MTTELCTYHAFCKRRKIEVKADTSYHALLAAAKILKPRRDYEISVVLVADENDVPVVHSTASL